MKDLFEKLARQETEFKDSVFLSPVIRDKPIRVRINGVILSMSVAQPNHFSGWGVFTPRNFKEAILVRQPSLAERTQYLNLFPPVRFVLAKQEDQIWYGIPLTQDKVSGIVPIHFAEEVQIFDVVQARFDGVTCWYEGSYEKVPLQNAQYLRESFTSDLEPDKLNLPGISQAERNSYLFAWTTNEAAKKSREEQKIRLALTRAGAEYRGHIERGDTYTIDYVVDGHNHRSVISKNLDVQTSGICLSGQDRTFDLQSLVTVMRESHDRYD